MKPRNIIIIVILLVVIAGLGLVGYRLFTSESSATSEEMQHITVERGKIATSVSATGSIVPKVEVALSFKSSGRVTEVNVKEGDKVKAGQVLARLETRDLEFQVAQARASLRLAQAQLDQVKKGPRPEDIAATEANLAIARGNLRAAQASLASARANLAMLLAGPGEIELQTAKERWDQAKTSLWAAQLERDGLAGNKMTPRYAVDSANARVAAAETAANIARLQYEQAQAGPKEEQVVMARSQVDQVQGQVEMAQAQVDQAQAALDKLKNSPTPEELAIVQARLDQAQATLEQAQAALDGAIIVAPFAGTVASVDAALNELVTPNRPTIVLVDLSGLHLEVDVDEADIGGITEGQEVIVTIDAFPYREFSGRAEAIAPTATLEGGVVSYRVTIGIEDTDTPLRVGMTANARIVTDAKEDVLLVPNRAIAIDRDSGKMYVEKLVEEKSILVEIEAGIRNDVISEVISGLEEGDHLVIRDISGRERFRQMWSLPGGQ